MLHIKKKTIFFLQFAKNNKSISSELRSQEEVKNGSLKKALCVAISYVDWSILPKLIVVSATSPYCLMSFEGKSEAELIRLMFVVARERFIDTRITEEDWEIMKSRKLLDIHR